MRSTQWESLLDAVEPPVKPVYGHFRNLVKWIGKTNNEPRQAPLQKSPSPRTSGKTDWRVFNSEGTAVRGRSGAAPQGNTNNLPIRGRSLCEMNELGGAQSIPEIPRQSW